LTRDSPQQSIGIQDTPSSAPARRRRLDTAVPWQLEPVRSRRLPLLGGAAIGVLIAFLFDPRLGRGRRIYLRDRVVGIAHRRARRSRRLVRMIGSYGRGY